tara:strand:+ start:549 stop:710 length:162 start_codon:yes stop_codon:yes gene_type:complete
MWSVYQIVYQIVYHIRKYCKNKKTRAYAMERKPLKKWTFFMLLGFFCGAGEVI